MESCKLKPCPFCGSDAKACKKPLWREYNGVFAGGYSGCYEFVIECSNPECRCKVYMGQNDTIYRDERTAKQNAINAWNHRSSNRSKGKYAEWT